MTVLYDDWIKGPTRITCTKAWVTVGVSGWGTVPVRIGDDHEGSKKAPSISQGSQYGYPVPPSGSITVRPPDHSMVWVTVREWDSRGDAPDNVLLPVIGTTAKGRHKNPTLPADGVWRKVDEPSIGEFACTVQNDPANNGIMEFASNFTEGIRLNPGQTWFIPAWNGTLMARYTGDDKSGRCNVVKHENAFMWTK